MGNELQIVEVSARDGLQNECVHLSVDQKVQLIGKMISAGARRLEVGSFVNPVRVPQMAETDQVVLRLPDRSDVNYIGLCLNGHGLERAITCRAKNVRGVDEIGCVIAASDAFGIANQKRTSSETVADARAIMRRAASEGFIPQVTIAVAFGCPFEGRISIDRVIEIACQLAEAEPVEIAVADTVGVAVPSQVTDLIGAMRHALPGEMRLRAHFHDTRSTGIANSWAAWQAGVDVLDSSLGGLGGCPFAPGSSGNVATEDLVYLFEHSGIATGIDLSKAIETNRWLGNQMGKALLSRVAQVEDS